MHVGGIGTPGTFKQGMKEEGLKIALCNERRKPVLDPERKNLMGWLSLCTKLCRSAYSTLETEVVVRGFDGNSISDLCWLPRTAERTVDRTKGLPRGCPNSTKQLLPALRELFRNWPHPELTFREIGSCRKCVSRCLIR